MVQGVAVQDGCLVNTNPATGEIISRVPMTSNDAVDAMIAAAGEAQEDWADIPLTSRIQMLRDAVAAVAKSSDEIASMVNQEMGKPIGDARLEIDIALSRDKFFNLLESSLKPETFGNSTILRHPLGVAAIMSPWNFPVAEILAQVLPAIASGNTVIVKPSEVVPETGAMVVAALSSALPSRVIQIAQGDGSVGAHLVAHPDVKLIAMTGSSSTGRKIIEVASKQMKRLVLEMGGKDPMIVFDDADLDQAAKDAVAFSVFNAGQICCAFERIYVAESVYEDFQNRCVEEAKKYVVGNGADEQVKVGPMVSSMQRDHVRLQVEDSIAKGCKLLYRSAVPAESGGSFYPVTVLADVTSEMALFQSETFGPVVSICKFDGSEKTAVQLANDSEYGLASSVYAQDTDKARRVANKIVAGQVGVNCVAPTMSDIHCPWVGHKASGYGFHSGVDGFRQFSVPKSVVLGG